MGEIELDAKVTLPTCGKCADPIPEGDDKISYIASRFQNSSSKGIEVEA